MERLSGIDFTAIKGFICDMDGVIYHGNQILPGVREFIQWLQEEHKEYLFLTNNSGYTRRELNQKLARCRRRASIFTRYINESNKSCS